MRWTVILGLIVIGSSGPVYGARRDQVASVGRANREIRAIEDRRRTAIREGDVPALEAIYAADFQGILGNGDLVDRSGLLAIFKKAPADVVFETTEIAVRDIDSTTALFTGRLTGRNASGQVVSDSRFTHLFAERDGRWQCVAGQSTPMPSPIQKVGQKD